MTTFIFMDGRTIDRIGMGVMRLTGQPGNFGPYPEWDAGIALLREAANAGVRLFDSARAYGPRHADRLLGDALGEDPRVMLATKGGIDKLSPTDLQRDASPAVLDRQIADATEDLRRVPDLFQLHWVDPEVPLETSVEALARAQSDGRIRRIGLSNVSLDELERASRIAPISSVQNRLNLEDAEHREMVAETAARGIAFLPYGPLGAAPMKPGAKLEPGEALGWLVRLAPNVIPIPGTTQAAHMHANIEAMRAAALERA
ncbi:aldo/keto reductase [Jannaschia aquimarina]|uniref:YdbC protein n=1 Tax=Jannaschia aquimarina TaxID=935700 RepID=A0A0D1CQ28_9RHOB|nr:aldo/keto reductase [Jannaschia aquimarina]KIT16837.1 putative oxidoreductase YdbC [Jannaschia aquimarina]SNT13263.1 Predicted oxidoreductase [Jannaschia aquimarina]